MPITQSKTKTLHFRDFSGGINRTDARPSISDNELYWCVNAQPIGKGQLQILPPPADPITSVSQGVVKMFGILMQISGQQVSRLITVNADGSIYSIDPSNGVKTTVASPGSVTSLCRFTMWQNTYLLIGDPTYGYMSWDGTTLMKYPASYTGSSTSSSPTITGISPSTVGLAAGMSIVSSVLPVGTTIVSVNSSTSITVSANATSTSGSATFTVGNGAPKSVRDLAVFSGSACLLISGRTIQIAAPASFTDFQIADGSTTIPITDSVFPGNITRILSALEVLWVIGPGAVNAESNVQITTGNVRTYSNTNIVANVGTLWPSSVTSFFRTFIFLTPYGVYAIVGATPQNLSEKLNNLFPYFTFNADNPSAVCTLTRIYIWAQLITYTDPDTGIKKNLIFCLSQNSWFVADQGNLQWITSIINISTGNPELWGTDGVNIYKCFAGTATNSWKIMTKFYDLGAFTQLKQIIRMSVQIQASQGDVEITAISENSIGASSTTDLAPTVSSFTWTTSAGTIFIWTTNSLQPFIWGVIPSQLQGPVDISGDLVGFTLEGNSLPFQLTGLAYEFIPGGEWTSTL